MKKSATAFAPCSTANLGPGFDVFGLALDALEDRVKVTKLDKGSGISIHIQDDNKGIPLEPSANSAGRVIEKSASVIAVLTGNLMKDPSYTVDYHTDALTFEGNPIKGNFANRPVTAAADKEEIRRLIDF